MSIRTAGRGLRVGRLIGHSTVIFIFRSTTRTQEAGGGLRNGRLVLVVRGKL